MLHTLHAHPSGTIASHRIALPQHHIITHACPPITTARGHRAVEHRYAVTWRGVTSFGQPSSVPANCQSQKSAMRAISGPWELLPLQLHHCTLPRCTTQDWQQATPVCVKVTARSTPRPITPSIYSRVPEPLALHPGVLPLVSDPHQRCGTPTSNTLYCSWPNFKLPPGQVTPLSKASAIGMRRPWQHRVSHTACCRRRRRLPWLLFATACTHPSCLAATTGTSATHRIRRGGDDPRACSCDCCSRHHPREPPTQARLSISSVWRCSSEQARPAIPAWPRFPEGTPNPR
jgi:hypothetical protein